MDWPANKGTLATILAGIPTGKSLSCAPLETARSLNMRIYFKKSNLLALACALTLVVAAACSSESGEGSSPAGEDGSQTSADGASTLEDGQSGADSASGTDAGASTDAGSGGAADTTQADSGPADTGAADTGSGGGTTDTGSGGTTDTGSGGGSAEAEMLKCLTQKCSSEVTGCLGDSDCGKAVGCLGGCKGDTTCLIGCGTGLSSGAQQKLLAVMQCGGQQGCINLGGGGGGGGGGKCGDGTCDLGEQLTCPKDCPQPQCGDGKCETGEQILCPKDCGGGGGAKCGDGTCDLGEQITCPQDCGGGGGGKCGDGNCDLPSETTMTCPQDCAGGGGGGQCGDGQCQTGEQITCPQDCSGGGGTNLTTCIFQKCATESTACVLDFAGCSSAGVCVAGCKDSTCVAKCGDKLTGASQTKFQALRACVDKNCFTP
ncbi:MAG: hypothetical protein KC502_18665 [Myxococcales bacterium]|nr:hypothetical protein [Myxococcales bacterium]